MRVIEPVGGVGFPDLRDFWRHRDLVYYLARRDVVVRYKQAVVGALWVVLQPLLMAAVFSFFLGKLAKVPSEAGVPYPLFAVSGLVMWFFFARAIEAIAGSTVEHQVLITKIYFPRVLIPVAAVIAPGVDFLIGFAVVIVVALAYDFPPGAEVLAMPLPFMLAMMTAVGSGLWLSALNVRYRDIRLVVPFLLLLGLFVTPITYPFDLVPDSLQPFYVLNPMVGVLEGFRWWCSAQSGPGRSSSIPLVISLILLVSGAAYFQRAERGFADVM